MINKHILMLCYPTHHAYYLAQRYAEALGYEVSLYGIEWVEEVNAIALIDKDNPHLLTVEQIANFDVVAIVVDERTPHIETPLISKEFVNNLKERVRSTETQKGSSIQIIGINFGLSGKKLQEQAVIFNGLFVSTEEEMCKYLG